MWEDGESALKQKDFSLSKEAKEGEQKSFVRVTICKKWFDQSIQFEDRKSLFGMPKLVGIVNGNKSAI